MNVPSVRKAIVFGLSALAIGAAAGKVSQWSSEKAGTIRPHLRTVKLLDFHNIPADLHNRITFLLEKGELPCEKGATLPKHAHTKIPIGNGRFSEVYWRTDLQDWEQLSNCHAAAFFVASGRAEKDAAVSSMFPELIPDTLKEYGFRKIEGTNFLPGDYLLFTRRYNNSVGQDGIDYTHSAIYLGDNEGRHFVFQKRNLGCGNDFPFEIGTLNKARNEFTENRPDEIMAFRRFGNIETK